MNVTFIIGNGFDLHLGMKTSYKDMYDGYINSLNLDEDIIRFKAELKKEAPTNYTNWSDFEKTMGERAYMFNSEAEFVKCIRDFKKYMISHLKNEQDKIMTKISELNSNQIISDVIKVSLNDFYNHNTPNVQNEIKRIKSIYGTRFDFISFNYTKVFDELITVHFRYIKEYKPDIIHVHGTLDNDVVLGVNASSDINCSFELSRRAERAFVKPEFNKDFDKSRVKRAEATIKESDILCIYGMSLGVTDKIWVEKIKEWLLASSDNHLFYFIHNKTAYENYDWDERMDFEDEQKQIIANKIFGNEMFDTVVLEQIHIPVGYDIFNLEKEFQAKKELNELKQTLLVNN